VTSYLSLYAKSWTRCGARKPVRQLIPRDRRGFGARSSTVALILVLCLGLGFVSVQSSGPLVTEVHADLGDEGPYPGSGDDELGWCSKRNDGAEKWSNERCKWFECKLNEYLGRWQWEEMWPQRPAPIGHVWIGIGIGGGGDPPMDETTRVLHLF